jgi:uncharacterized protein (DUF2336 family)
MKVPRIAWLSLSLVKFLRRRGPNCCERIASATMVTEKVIAAIWIIAVATVTRTSRAPLAPARKSQGI